MKKRFVEIAVKVVVAALTAFPDGDHDHLVYGPRTDRILNHRLAGRPFSLPAVCTGVRAQ